jgi:DNA-binding transcriptional MerR regulator
MPDTNDIHREELTVPQGVARDSYGSGRPSAAATAGNAVDGTPEDAPMTIGEVARDFGMTVRALRFYESKRLLTPLRHGAKRLYRRSDRKRLVHILTGRRLGFTLAEIGDLVGRASGTGLHLTRAQCVEQINLLERQKRGLEMALAELRQIYSSYYKAFLESPHP